MDDFKEKIDRINDIHVVTCKLSNLIEYNVGMQSQQTVSSGQSVLFFHTTISSWHPTCA